MTFLLYFFNQIKLLIFILTICLINFLIYLFIICLTLHLYFYVDHIIALIVLYVLYFSFSSLIYHHHLHTCLHSRREITPGNLGTNAIQPKLELLRITTPKIQHTRFNPWIQRRIFNLDTLAKRYAIDCINMQCKNTLGTIIV